MLQKNVRLQFLSMAFAALFCAGCGAEQEISKEELVTEVDVWTYYNGEQLSAFHALVDEFNETVGREQGIRVSSYSHGSINDLEANVVAAAEERVGASELPNIFSAYADTAYLLDKKEMLVDLRDYMTEEECAAYIEDYLKEGDFSGDGSIKIFPVVKSTELLFLNQTDWEPFAREVGVSYEDLQTIEGVVRVSELYYQWTDAMTDTPNDGCAFFGRDALANYMLIGARQLGCTIFEVQNGHLVLNFDKDVVRKLWDYYYVPFVKGYFASSGRFRSDDIKIGNILAYVGSTSSYTFFPKQVIVSDTKSHEIQMKLLPSPRFQNGKHVIAQQGAGMAVTRASEQEIQASVTFLKWFTEPEHNIQFSVNSGYFPVTEYASNMEHILESGVEMDDASRELLSVSMDEIHHNELYTTEAFSDGSDARDVIQYAISDQADIDKAVVKERILQGMSPEEAYAEFLSDEYFESWYQKTLAALQGYED